MGELVQYHPSGVEKFFGCGEAFRREIIEGERNAPSAAMVVGTAVDRSVRENLEYKRQYGELLEPENVKAEARDTLEALWDAEVLLDEGETKDSSINKAVGLAGLHHEKLAPIIQPVHVARKWVLDVAGYPFQIAGEIDVQEPEDIRDTKTKKQAPPADMAHDDLKMTAYAMAAEKLDGVRPKAVKLDVLWETPKKRDRKFRVLESTRDERDYQAFLNRVVLMHSSIQAGIFGAAEQGNNWRCSEKYCGFFRTCRYARQPKSVAVPDLVPLLSESIERGKNGNETTERS